MTSTPTDRVRFFVGAVWLVMLVQAVVYVARYALINPYVDEWEFVPYWFHERPAWPWLWALHNEHRFPLARVLYLALFWTTGELRLGCYVTLAGLALTALVLTRVVQRWRGGPHVTDAVFPLLLLHVGQDENLYMGYQMCFMLLALLSALLLRVLMQPATYARLLQAAGLGGLLLLCGAGGLAMGWCVALWLVVGAWGGALRGWQRLTLIALSACTPLYTVLYFQGYQRPAHHPPSAGVIESVKVALQAESMIFGPAGSALWPGLGLALLLLGFGVVILLVLRWRLPDERRRAVGLLLFTGASFGVALGIGWGRSGFHDDKGFAWRYGLLLAPTLWGAYAALLTTSPRVAWGASYGLFVFALLVLPANTISAFRDGEKLRAHERAWEADVRAGFTPEELLAKYHPQNSEWAAMLRLFQKHRYAYYADTGGPRHE